MLKKIVLAMMPLALLATTAKADDLSVDAASITDANVEIVTNDLDIDVDALSADAGEDTETAIEACFRRFGYRYRGWGGYRHNFYRGGYNGCYNYCRPLYSYRSFCYQPVYRCVVAPIYNCYWGCY